MEARDILELKFRVSLLERPYDVPVKYSYEEFQVQQGQWPAPVKEEIEGRLRRAVDYIALSALLPAMEGYSEKNSARFAQMGWGDKVQIILGRRQSNWPLFFQTVGPRLLAVPTPARFEGMHAFLDESTGDDVFLSHVRPSFDITRVVCGSVARSSFPFCEVLASYEGDAEMHIRFGRSHMNEWRSIALSVKGLLDQFNADAAHRDAHRGARGSCGAATKCR